MEEKENQIKFLQTKLIEILDKNYREIPIKAFDEL